VYTGKDSSYSIKYLLLHEISHVLGFCSWFFEKLDLSFTKNGLTYINSKRVLQKVRQHFNCPTIEGIQLEDQGEEAVAGNHWEPRYMLGDYMISMDYSEKVISDITLAFFEDTGYYKVNYYTGGLFRFGKNQGCKFFEKECVTENGEKTEFSNEFCTEPGMSFCSSGHLSKGSCSVFSPANYCPVSQWYSSRDYAHPRNCNFGKKDDLYIEEKVGKKSLCFESYYSFSWFDYTLNYCYEVECNKEKKEYQLSVENDLINCKSGDIIVEYPKKPGFTIKCPPYNIICTSTIWCNELFECIDLKSETDITTFDYDSMSFISLNKIIIFLDIFFLLFTL